MREYALRNRVEALEQQLAERTQVQDAKPVWLLPEVRKVVDREAAAPVPVSVVDVQAWFAAHMHGDCLRRMYKKVSDNPFDVCTECKQTLRSIMELLVRGA
jgi:hypothetical protein